MSYAESVQHGPQQYWRRRIIGSDAEVSLTTEADRQSSVHSFVKLMGVISDVHWTAAVNEHDYRSHCRVAIRYMLLSFQCDITRGHTLQGRWTDRTGSQDGHENR